MTLHAVGWTHVCVGVQLRVMLSVLPGGEDRVGAERNQGSGNLASLGFVADIFGKSGDILDSPLLPASHLHKEGSHPSLVGMVGASAARVLKFSCLTLRG